MADIIKPHAVGACVIGVIEMILAVIVVICSFVLAGKASIATSLTPYWAGLPYLVPGILGVLLLFKRNLCLMIAFLVCNIVIFIIEGIAFIIIAIVLAVYSAYAENGGCTYYPTTLFGDGRCLCTSGTDSWTFATSKGNCDLTKDVLTLLYVLVVVLALAACASLAGSILGCVGTCCRQSEQHPGTVVMQVQQPTHVYNQPQQVGYNQPPAYYANPPPVSK